MRYLFVFIAIILGAIDAVSAQQMYVSAIGGASTQVLKMGGGGWLVGGDVAPNGQQIARPDVYSPFIRTSGGTWKTCITQSSFPSANFGWAGTGPNQNAGGAYEITAAPSTPATIYMAYAGLVFKSTDGCNSWNQLTAFNSGVKITMVVNTSNYRFNGRKIAVDPANPNVALIGTDLNGLFLTRDGGTSFSTVSGVPTAVAFSSGQNPSYSIAFDASGGTTTCPTVGGTCTKNIYAIGYTATDTVYFSSDAGVTWTQTSGGPTQIQHMVACPDGTIWAATGLTTGGIQRYRAPTWTTISAPTTGIHSIACDPLNSDHIVAGTTGGGLFISTNGTTSATFAAAGGFTRIATDVPWLAVANETFMSNGDMQFNGSGEIDFFEGIGFWTATPPAAAAPFNWTSSTAPIEELPVTEITSPGGYAIVGVQDRGSYTLTNPSAYPTTQFPAYNDLSNLIVGWGIDHASSNPNFIAYNFSPVVGNQDMSGSSSDGGLTGQPFNSWYQTFAGGSATITNNGGLIQIKVASTAGLTSWSAGVGTIVHAVGCGNGCTGYRAISVDDSTHISLLGTNYTSTYPAGPGSCSCIVLVHTSPMSDFSRALYVTGTTNNGTAIRVNLVAPVNKMGTQQPIHFSGIGGTTEANGDWIISSIDNPTQSVTLGPTSTFTNAWTGGGVGTSIPPLGGAIAASTPQNIVNVYGQNNYPYCTLDGGQTWTQIALPAPIVISAATYSTNTITLTVASNPTTAYGLVANVSFIVSGMTPAGYNGAYVWSNTSSGTTLVGTRTYSDPGAATGFGNITPVSTGWISGAFNFGHRMVADRATPNTFYGYNFQIGTVEIDGCTPKVNSTQILTGQNNFASIVKSSPTKAGNIWLASGTSTSGVHPVGAQKLWFSPDGAVSGWCSIGNVSEPLVIDLGATKPGTNYPIMYMAGWANPGTGLAYGIWASTNLDVVSFNSGTCTGSPTWTLVETYPLGSMDNIQSIAADRIWWNHWYLGWAGSGAAYGTQNFLLKRDLSPANDNTPVWLNEVG